MATFSKKLSLGIFLTLAVLLSIAAYAYVKKSSQELDIETVSIQRQSLQEIVSVTGRVQPTTKIDLGFEQSGKIRVIDVEIGDQVVANEELISLDRTDLQLELISANATLENEQALISQYQAALSAEQSLLLELQKGTRTEDIQIAQTKVTNAQNSLENAKTNLANVQTTANQDLENAYDNAKDVLSDVVVDFEAIMTLYTDEFFHSESYKENDLVYPTTNAILESDIRSLRSSSNNNLLQLESLVKNVITFDQIDQALLTTDNYLETLTTYLNKLNASLTISVGLTDAEKNAFQSSINTSRLAVASNESSISSTTQIISSQKIQNANAIDAADASVNDAENALRLAQDELILKQAGNTAESIQSQQSRVDQAQANIQAQEAKIRASRARVDLIQDQLDDRILRSPIAGIITQVEGNPGEIIAPNQVLVSVISAGALEIEANIPEVDIAKIKLGNIADITLDAYGPDQQFTATVVEIEPAETIIEGVPTYTVTFQFTEEDDRIKSGMTANIDILTAEADNVLAVPQRSILLEDGKRYARVYKNQEILQKPVTTGLISWDGLIEITSGLEEGEEVITYIEDAS